MSAQAIWKGVISFGDAEVPVKLYTAVEDRRLHFRLLHAPDRVPVQQRMINPSTGKEVPADEVRKGYETADGSFVVLEEEELQELEPEPSRTIEISRFVGSGSVPHPWYDRPYWLGPDEDPREYAALAAALAASGRDGIAHWVMRNKRYHGVLQAVGPHAMLITLRGAAEVVAAESLHGPEGRDLSTREVKMATELIEALEGEFEPDAYHDEYREGLRELIDAKIGGGAVKLRRFEPTARRGSLSDALTESLREARKRKPA